jgi:hypothetical protein
MEQQRSKRKPIEPSSATMCAMFLLLFSFYFGFGPGRLIAYVRYGFHDDLYPHLEQGFNERDESIRQRAERFASGDRTELLVFWVASAAAFLATLAIVLRRLWVHTYNVFDVVILVATVALLIGSVVFIHGPQKGLGIRLRGRR